MPRRIFHVPGVPDPVSPIPHAVVAGGTCHISGQLSTDDSGYVPGTAEEEADRAMGHILAIAKAAGFAREEIVYVDLAFADLDDLPAVNASYARHFPDAPARTIFEAKRLPYGARIKVQAVAQKDG